ncbi:hypothetical protein G3578_09100 [Brevibacillus sp. SYP-B805]|uniref:hypothetical protein n=1 Tax=Brevibacillus sp. SYP-B805 TaxID=1578199 RepID=UPI0013EA56BE|nr:hypothetical protein [Brevibacillus sp. SYP-B805]NGQ95310.1 hypothetical protein [Brevibacillus sp. SYP-B805]
MDKKTKALMILALMDVLFDHLAGEAVDMLEVEDALEQLGIDGQVFFQTHPAIALQWLCRMYADLELDEQTIAAFGEVDGSGTV